MRDYMNNNIKENDEWFERGSEWRLWDLHLHTPCSHDYKDKSVTNEEIINTLKDNNISAAVITDHFQIDVERINELIELGKTENILILPGIELTSELGGSQSVHFIGIFDNKNVKNLWDTLRIKLDLTKEYIESKGGFENLYLTIKDACNIIHKQGGIVSIHAGNKSNSVENVKNNFNFKQQQKKDLLSEYVDILEIPNKNEESNYQNKVFPDIKSKLPMVVCSDNHNIRNYTRKNCWIKSDLTFEGLKQIIYEPTERVRIQENKPDEKNSYEVIDSITFLDEDFPTNEIKLNSNLVSIIGGKSTGKSTLLRSIANTINPNSENNPEWSKLINPTVKIKWRNGNENMYQDSTIESEKDENKAQIKYIPQNYLTKQVLDMEDENSFSNNLIKEILFKDPQYKNIFDEIKNLENDYKTNLNESVVKLFDIEKQIDLENKAVDEIGSSDNINQEIEKLTEEYSDLQKSNSTSDDDLKNHNILKEKLIKIEDNINTLKTEKNVFQEVIDELDNNPYSNLISLIEKLNEPASTDLLNEIEIAISQSKQRISNKIEEHVSENNEKCEKIKGEYESVNKELKELSQRINTSEKMDTIFSKINIEKEKLKKLNEKLATIESFKSKYNENLSNIFKLNSEYVINLKSLIDKFEFEDEQSLFISECSFKINEFKDNLKNMIDNRNFPPFRDETEIDLDNLEYDKDFSNNLETIIHYILKDKLTIKSRYTKEDVLNKLLSPYHFLNFNISYEGDRLEKMSPGKRSFVILKVLITLDKSKWPILIDQPEDDLDANSISKDLTQFLKKTKKERQIIIVSHNPNLVVGADSEQIIIANQEGSEAKNKFTKFEYTSGSIENMYKNEDEECYLYSKGIKEHICDILEGGEESFRKRQKKYNIY